MSRLSERRAMSSPVWSLTGVVLPGTVACMPPVWKLVVLVPSSGECGGLHDYAFERDSFGTAFKDQYRVTQRLH